MSKKQKPTTLRVRKTIEPNHNQVGLKVHKHGPIGSNHNELALKVLTGIPLNHSEIALKACKALHPNHNETTRKVRVKKILLCEKTRQAIEMYHQARRAEQEGKVALAEVQYLRSRAAFEEVGGTQYLSIANVLNALTFLRWSRKDYAGALRSAKESAQIMENHGAKFSNIDANFIYSTSCELIDQIQYEMSLVSVR